MNIHCVRLKRIWTFFPFPSGCPTFSYPTTPTNNTPPQQPRLQVKAGEFVHTHTFLSIEIWQIQNLIAKVSFHLKDLCKWKCNSTLFLETQTTFSIPFQANRSLWDCTHWTFKYFKRYYNKYSRLFLLMRLSIVILQYETNKRSLFSTFPWFSQIFFF